MATKKQLSDSLIGVELEKFDKKLAEFQNYLQMNPITSMVNKKGAMEIETDDMEVNHHKEIDTQIKIMNSILVWLPTLEKLRETSNKQKKLETRGDVELPGMASK